MTRHANTRRPPQRRLRSREEMAEVYRQIVASDPNEGPRLVEVHRTLIGMLDRMIEERARRKSRRA